MHSRADTLAQHPSEPVKIGFLEVQARDLWRVQFEYNPSLGVRRCWLFSKKTLGVRRCVGLISSHSIPYGAPGQRAWIAPQDGSSTDTCGVCRRGLPRTETLLHRCHRYKSASPKFLIFKRNFKDANLYRRQRVNSICVRCNLRLWYKYLWSL